MLKQILIFILFILIIYLIYSYIIKYNLIPNNKCLNCNNLITTNTNENFNIDNYINQEQISTESQFNNIFEDYLQSKPKSTSIIKPIIKPIIKSTIRPILKQRQRVFMDISIDEQYLGQVQIELFDDIVPHTCKNYIYMINNHYKDSIFHRIIDNFMIQGGDYINRDGTGSNSIYGERFPDENFILKHDEKYLLSMANAGPDTNGCQFFITLDVLEHLDGKHVVFGKIIDEESKQIIDQLANVNVDTNNKPSIECKIVNCGLL